MASGHFTALNHTVQGTTANKCVTAESWAFLELLERHGGDRYKFRGALVKVSPRLPAKEKSGKVSSLPFSRCSKMYLLIRSIMYLLDLLHFLLKNNCLSKKEHIQVFVLLISLLLILQRCRIFSGVRNDSL